MPEDRKIRYRVAASLGDVIFDEGDVYGDGVNIAARLEALAEPGGVVVSGTAYDHLKSNVEVGYEDLGEQHGLIAAVALLGLVKADSFSRINPEPEENGHEQVCWSRCFAEGGIGLCSG